MGKAVAKNDQLFAFAFFKRSKLVRVDGIGTPKSKIMAWRELNPAKPHELRNMIAVDGPIDKSYKVYVQPANFNRPFIKTGFKTKREAAEYAEMVGRLILSCTKPILIGVNNKPLLTR